MSENSSIEIRLNRDQLRQLEAGGKVRVIATTNTQFVITGPTPRPSRVPFPYEYADRRNPYEPG